MPCSASERNAEHLRFHYYSTSNGIFSLPIAPLPVKHCKTPYQTQKLRKLNLREVL